METVIKSIRNQEKEVLYLCDYELQGQECNGIDLITKNSLAQDAILVSSRFDEHEVFTRADELKLKRIPKGLAHIVPISIQTRGEDYDAILVDDDILIHEVWKLAAKKNNKRIACYFHPNNFFKRCNDFNLETSIYLDEELGEGIRGSDVAKVFWEKGFKDITLATGHKPSNFENNLYIKNIQDKSPPWQ